MNRRTFASRFGRYAALAPFLGMAGASPQGQTIEGELPTVEHEAQIVSYGPIGAETEDYGLWLGNRMIARGHFVGIVARGEQLARAIWPDAS